MHGGTNHPPMAQPGAHVWPGRPSLRRFAAIRYIQIIVSTAMGMTTSPMTELALTCTLSLNFCSLISLLRNFLACLASRAWSKIAINCSGR